MEEIEKRVIDVENNIKLLKSELSMLYSIKSEEMKLVKDLERRFFEIQRTVDQNDNTLSSIEKTVEELEKMKEEVFKMRLNMDTMISDISTIKTNTSTRTANKFTLKVLLISSIAGPIIVLLVKELITQIKP